LGKDLRVIVILDYESYSLSIFRGIAGVRDLNNRSLGVYRLGAIDPRFSRGKIKKGEKENQTSLGFARRAFILSPRGKVKAGN